MYRVYHLGGEDGVEKLIETERHQDRVDSIQWCHKGLMFVSGSRDGTALVWRYETQQWKNLVLNMTDRLPGWVCLLWFCLTAWDQELFIYSVNRHRIAVLNRVNWKIVFTNRKEKWKREETSSWKRFKKKKKNLKRYFSIFTNARSPFMQITFQKCKDVSEIKTFCLFCFWCKTIQSIFTGTVLHLKRYVGSK